MADFLINVVVNTQGATRGVQQVDRSLTSIERSLNRVQRLIGTVFAFQSLGAGIRAFTTLADSLTLAENRFRAVGVAANRTAGLTSALFGIANRTRTSFASVTEVFQRASIALSSLGAGEQEVIDFTRTLTQTIALSGATTAEAEGALRQFTQGLAANRLSGQELNSVLEQLPFLARIIANELGVNVGQLRELANQGLITGAVLRSAIANAGPEIARLFGTTIPTISQSFVVLQNRVTEVAGGFLQASGASASLAQGVLGLANNLEVVLRVASALAIALAINLAGRAIPLVIAGVRALTLAIATNPFGALAVAVTVSIGFLVAFSDQIRGTNDGVATLADVAIVAFGRLRDGVVTAFNAISDLINQFIPNLDLINLSFEDIARGAAAAFDNLVAVVRAGISIVTDIVGNFGPVIQDAFTQGFNGAIDVVEDAINLIINGIGELPGAVFDVARDAVLSFASVFDIGFDDIIAFVSNIPQRIADGLRGLVGIGADAGRSLVQGIDDAIDIEVDATAGRIAVTLGRLQNPASGALQQVGDNAGRVFAESVAQAPVTAALEGVLEEARVRGVARAAEVGEEVGASVGQEAAAAILREQGAFESALGGLLDAVTRFTGLSEQEFKNFSANIATILGGVNLEQAFGNALQGLATLVGTTRVDLVNAFGGVINILGELGFTLEDVFGERGAQAVRILGVVTSEQFQSILTVGADVFGKISGLISGIGPAATSTIAGLQSMFTTITTGGAAASAALAPIAVVILGIGVIVLATLAIFGVFGDEVQEIAIILAIVFAPFVFSIQLIIIAVELLTDLFDDLGLAGGTAGTILQIALAPIIIPILLIIEAVEFLIDLFGSLGSAGGTLGVILQIALAPIIIPIQLIIIAVEFLIDLFGGLGDAGGVLGTVLQIALAPIIIPIQLIIIAVEFLIDLFGFLGDAGGIASTILQVVLAPIVLPILAIIEVVKFLIDVFGDLGDIVGVIGDIVDFTFDAIVTVVEVTIDILVAAFNFLLDAVTAIFNAIASAATAAFNAIVSAGQALLSALQSIFNTLLNVAGSVFNGILSVGKAAFNGLVSAAQSAAGAIGGVLGGILGGIKSVGAQLSSLSSKAGSTIGNIGSSLGIGSKGGIAGKITAPFKAAEKEAARLRALGFSTQQILAQVPLAKNLKKFSRGGVINDPVSLDGQGLGGKALQRGGLLPSNTLIGSAQNVTGSGQLGLAGESGPEAILPLSRTSQGLGVTASLPPELLRVLQSNDNRGGTTIIQGPRIILINARDETVEDIQAQLDDVDASIEPRTDVRISELLQEVA